MSYVDSARWLLLGHQLPTRSSNARVKTWRRLQQVGAVPTRNSVYVLPNIEQCREDFEWIRSEIVALGGEATVFAADAISEHGTDDIEAMFRRSRAQEYRALKSKIDRLLAPRTGKSRRSPAVNELKSRTVRTLREKLTAIERVDFFKAPGGTEAAAVLEALEHSTGMKRPIARQATFDHAQFKDRRWVTRPRPGVDRMASAWLIRRFVDSNATFAFVDQPDDSDVPFDMYSGEFSHQGNACTFEVLSDRFGLESPGIARLGQIVHDLDMKDSKYRVEEAVAVGRIVEGLRALHTDDAVLLDHGIGMFDALARSFESDKEAIGSLATPSGAKRAPRRR